MKISTLCYIKYDDKYLMIHRNKRDNDLFKGYWNGIGGKLNTNESPEDGVIREAKEETGLTISRPQLKGIITFPNNHDTDETWYVFVFVVTEFKGDLKENEEGTLKWVPIKDILTLNIQNADKHFFIWLNKDKIFSAKIHYKGKDLEDYQVHFY